MARNPFTGNPMIGREEPDYEEVMLNGGEYVVMDARGNTVGMVGRYSEPSLFSDGKTYEYVQDLDCVRIYKGFGSRRLAGMLSATNAPVASAETPRLRALEKEYASLASKIAIEKRSGRAKISRFVIRDYERKLKAVERQLDEAKMKLEPEIYQMYPDVRNIPYEPTDGSLGGYAGISRGFKYPPNAGEIAKNYESKRWNFSEIGEYQFKFASGSPTQEPMKSVEAPVFPEQMAQYIYWPQADKLPWNLDPPASVPTWDGGEKFSNPFEMGSSSPGFGLPEFVQQPTKNEVKQYGQLKNEDGKEPRPGGMSQESYSALFAKMDQITTERSKQIAKGFFRQEYEKTKWPKLARDSEVVQEQKAIYEKQLKELEAAKIVQLQAWQKQADLAEREARIRRIVAASEAAVRVYVCAECSALTSKYYGDQNLKLCIICWQSNNNRNGSPREQAVILVYPDGSEKKMRLTRGGAVEAGDGNHPVLCRKRKIRGNH